MNINQKDYPMCQSCKNYKDATEQKHGRCSAVGCVGSAIPPTFGCKYHSDILNKPIGSLHYSAPIGYKCADCTIHGTTCPDCYSLWYNDNICHITRLKPRAIALQK